MIDFRSTLALLLVCESIVATSLLTTKDTSKFAQLPDGYVPFPDIGVAYKYFAEELEWDDAKKRCSDDNGELAVIDTENKLSRVASMNLPEDGWATFVGIRRTPEDGKWTDSKGVPLNDLPWDLGNPEDQIDCMVLDNDKYLSNSPCSFYWPFLCELPLVVNVLDRPIEPEPSTIPTIQ